MHAQGGVQGTQRVGTLGPAGPASEPLGAQAGSGWPSCGALLFGSQRPADI